MSPLSNAQSKTGSHRCDVIVLGGGAAGIAAAYAAARKGCSVILLEKYGFLGGLAASAWVGTICGLYMPVSNEGELSYGVGHFPQEFAERVRKEAKTSPVALPNGLAFLPVQPLVFSEVARKLLAEVGVEVCTHATFFSASASASAEGEVITNVEALLYNDVVSFEATAFVDATGEALLSHILELPCRPVEVPQAATLSVALKGISDCSFSPKGMRHVSLAVLRESIGVTASVLPALYGADGVVLKLTSGTTPRLPEEFGREEQKIRASVDRIMEVLRAEVPGFSKAVVSELTPQLGVRAGRRPLGKDMLSDEAVLHSVKPKDGVAVGCWPIERWQENGAVKLTYLEGDQRYLVPAGALASQKCRNLWFGGRSISAEENAIASARVIGTALGTGYAAGSLAAGTCSGALEAEIVEEIRETEGI